MAGGQLPDEGPVRLGPVSLPAGRVVMAGYGSGGPVAWATDDPVPEPGRVWAALSAVRDQTGLVPILLDGLYGDADRPWDEGEFEDPEDPRQADTLDAGALLEDWWNRGNLPGDAGRFPGLAPAERVPLSPAERQAAFDTVLPRLRARRRPPAAAARIGLVAADRPADVPAAIGWAGCQRERTAVLTITAVLRSWEDRFGAVLVEVGFADLRLLVERPPRGMQAAQRIAAEHSAFADECIESYRDIPGIAASLVKSPVWTFWWD